MNRERRAVLRVAAALTGTVLGGGALVGSGAATGDSGVANRGEAAVARQVDASLPAGVTLFDLNDDGAYTATVESASDEVQDDAHPAPIHVTSGGRATVDFAASIVQPGGEVALGDLETLTYDFYEGPENGSGSGGDVPAPDQTFLVVENADGRHGMYLTSDAGGDAEEWLTFDVLARMQGDSGDGWFEYTTIESGYSGKTFGNVVERFGADATLALVGVGHGDAVNPAVLDVYYDNLTVNGETRRFPTDVAKRV